MYDLQALIGSQLETHARAFKEARVVPIGHGLQLVPLTDKLWSELGGGVPFDWFERRSEIVEHWANEISSTAPVAYVEAEFFGGVGSQSAVAWSDGSRVLGPIHAEDSINQALRFLGVRSDGVHDEFDAVNLGRHRTTKRWRASAR